MLSVVSKLANSSPDGWGHEMAKTAMVLETSDKDHHDISLELPRKLLVLKQVLNGPKIHKV